MITTVDGVEYRYTEWVAFNSRYVLAPDFDTGFVAGETYNHNDDAMENTNVYTTMPESLKTALSGMLQGKFRRPWALNVSDMPVQVYTTPTPAPPGVDGQSLQKSCCSYAPFTECGTPNSYCDADKTKCEVDCTGKFMQGAQGTPPPASKPPSPSSTAPASQQPHLVFVLADDMGWADASWHRPDGFKETSTPRMHSLLKDGIELDRMYAFK